MTVFNQLMYLFKNEKVYDKMKVDKLVEEAIEMHKEYIAQDEKYQGYLDKVDNYMIINSKIKLVKMYEDKASYNQRIRNNINRYVEKKFKKDISQWFNELSEEQLFMIQDHLFEVKNFDELKNLYEK